MIVLLLEVDGTSGIRYNAVPVVRLMLEVVPPVDARAEIGDVGKLDLSYLTCFCYLLFSL